MIVIVWVKARGKFYGVIKKEWVRDLIVCVFGLLFWRFRGPGSSRDPHGQLFASFCFLVKQGMFPQLTNYEKKEMVLMNLILLDVCYFICYYCFIKLM